MSLRRFGLVTRALDPNKYARLVQKGLITELNEDVTNGISYIESAYSKRELKVKLGLTYEKDIIEQNTVENPVDNKKAGNTDESKPVEIQEVKSVSENLEETEVNPDLRESELSLREAELNSKELELNKKESELNNKQAGFEQKQSEFDKKLEKLNMQSSTSTNNDKGKQKFRLEVPEIHGTEYEDIQNFAKDIKTFKKLMKGEWSEEEIIFSTLVKSKKTALTLSMTTDEETKIEKFIEFLYSNYGHSPQLMWKKLRSIKQNNEENVLQFFNRVVKLFYSCRKSEVPSTISDEAHQQEIRNIFISGLNNIELRKQLNMNEVTINFPDLGKTAQSYSNGLKSAEEITNALKVLNIEAGAMSNDYNNSNRDFSYRSRSRERGRFRSRDRGYNRSRSRGYNRSRSRGYDRPRSGYERSRSGGRDYRYNDRSNSRNRFDRDRSRGRSQSRDRGDRREDRICFRCGQPGHIIKYCKASSRTVSQYKKRFERSQSRDRNRSYSRDRRDSREHRVRFDENSS